MRPVWIEGFASVEPFAEEGPPSPLDISLLERSLRRGLSELIRLCMHVARGALLMAERAPGEVQLVLASAFGELGTAEAIMAQALAENSASPARFRHSVHNSAVGLLSISADNRLSASALAAGHDTVAMGLLEAQLELAEGAGRVLLVFAEERVPAFLRAEADHGAAAVAFVLAADASECAFAQVGAPSRVQDRDMYTQAHPLEGALRLAELCRSGGSGRVIVGAGSQPYAVELTQTSRA